MSYIPLAQRNGSSGGPLPRVLPPPTSGDIPVDQTTVKPKNALFPTLSGDQGLASKIESSAPIASVKSGYVKLADRLTNLAVASDQGIARSVGTVGVTAGNVPTQIVNSFLKKKAPLPFAPETPTTGNDFANNLFGGQPIRTLPNAAENAQNKANTFASEIAGHPVAPIKKLGGYGLAIGGVLMDLSGFGGGKAVNIATDQVPEAFFKYVAKESNPSTIESTLKNVGLGEQDAKTLAQKLAPTKTVQEAKDVILAHGETPKSYIPISERGLPKEGKPIDTSLSPQEILAKAEADAAHLGKAKPVAVSNPQGPNSSEIPNSSLAVEARKYNSADEFVKNNTDAYHSTASSLVGDFVASKDGNMGAGVYLSEDANSAREAGAAQADGNLLDQTAYPVKILTNKIYKYDSTGYPEPALIEKIKKQGYDGIKNNTGEIVIFDPKNVRYGEQLTDIYNKATGKESSQVPMPEVKATNSPDSSLPVPESKPTFGMNGGDIGFTSRAERSRKKGIDAYLEANNRLRQPINSPPPTPPRGTTNIDQLQRMLQREQESLAAARANPEAHAKAYGGDRAPKYEAKIASLKARIEAVRPTAPTLIPKRVNVPKSDLPEPLAMRKIDIEQRREDIRNDPLKGLLQYVKNGQLPEVTGNGTSEFSRRGDKIIQGILGAGDSYNSAPDVEVVRARMEKYIERRAALREAQKGWSRDVAEYRKSQQAVRDEQALTLMAKRETVKETTQSEKDARLAEKRRAFDEGMRRAAEEERKKSQKSEDIYQARALLPKKMGFLQKIKSALTPAKYLEPETKDIFMKWERRLGEARNLANKEVGTLKSVPRGLVGFQTMLDYEVGKPTKWTRIIKTTFDKLYAESKARGLDPGFRENYLPHVYMEKPNEIAAKIKKYLTEEKGMSEADANAYTEGAKLNPSEARRLSLSPFFEKERVFPTYEVAMQYGLTPKYTHPDQLVAYYREQMERTLANIDFINSLRDRNKILTVEQAPSSWKAIELPFSYKGYYAEPKLARTLNAIFHDPANASISDTIFSWLAKKSRQAQEITLSGGVPYTNINFFSIGQAIKDITAGKLSSATAWFRANFTSASVRYFQRNQAIMNKMSEYGIDLSKNVTNYQDTYKNIVSNKNKPFLKKWASLAGEEFDKAFNEKTFKSYMPQVQIQLFKDIYEKALKDGIPEDVAAKTAADTTKTFYGLVEKQGRASTTENVVSSIFFAPKFREGIVNTLFNTAKSVSSEIRNPLFSRNRRLFAGMVLTFAAYNALNHKLNGHYMWQNPPGREFALRIPGKDGNVTYIEFMPSFLSFGRNMASGGIAIAKGDIDTAKQKFGSLLSMPIQIALEALGNKNYFGDPIYKDTDSNLQKNLKVIKFIGTEVNHPYIAQVLKILDEKTTLYHALVAAFEIPLKFGTLSNEAKNAFYDAVDAKAKANAKEMQKGRPLYDKLQKMKADGQTEEASRIYHALPADQKKVYDKIKVTDKSRATVNMEAAIYSTFERAQKLKADGKTQEATDLYNTLSPKEKKAYQKLKARFKN